VGLVDELALTASGKVRKVELEQQVRAGMPAGRRDGVPVSR